MPPGLSGEAQRLWRTTVNEFRIDDGPSFALLENACRSLMRLRDAEVLIRKERQRGCKPCPADDCSI
jgi:hypothetical protein